MRGKKNQLGIINLGKKKPLKKYFGLGRPCATKAEKICPVLQFFFWHLLLHAVPVIQWHRYESTWATPQLQKGIEKSHHFTDKSDRQQIQSTGLNVLYSGHAAKDKNKEHQVLCTGWILFSVRKTPVHLLRKYLTQVLGTALQTTRVCTDQCHYIHVTIVTLSLYSWGANIRAIFSWKTEGLPTPILTQNQMLELLLFQKYKL